MRYKMCLGLVLIRVAFDAARAFAAEDVTVTIDNFSFTPAELKVKAGTKVVFVNHDDIPHNVVGETVKFRSKPLDTNESFAFVFDSPGEVVYFCGLHPRMKGKLLVTP
ncbi:MAG TPA: cupredoxin family copper-binding protein [Methylocystis sp.]|nr:cupredoxin family copper-binding protein [Methylocystis sp.]